VLVIDASSAAPGASLADAWSSRELIYFLAWRDLKVRYKHTVLGALWAVIQPLATMAVFSVFFGRLAKVPSDGVPYPLFALTALVPWTYFSTAVSAAAVSLAGSQSLVSKVYFPRLAIPLASIVTPLVDAAIAMSMVVVALVAIGAVPGAALVAWPVFVFLLLGATAGVAIGLSALGAQYRDVRYVVPFLMQVWLFVTPVAYPTTLVPEAWRSLYGLNPMATVVDGFRWTLLGSPPPPASMAAASAFMVVVLLWGGLRRFRRTESRLADVL
jgi:lipopolysaccharide transport system permease protein